MIGFTFISMPKNEMTYLVSRAIQAIELLFFIILFVQFSKRPQRLNRFNMSVNLWWFLYTLLTYLFVAGVGLTPCFRWLNVVIFLLLGSCYWKENFEDSLKYIAHAFSFLIYLNAILLIIFPEGLWFDTEWVGRGDATRYLFGNYNQIGFVCLLGITTQAMYTLSTKQGKFNLILLIVISLASVIGVGSMTSTVGLTILAGYILIHKRIKRPRIYLWIFLTLYIAFFYIFIWYSTSIEEVQLITKFIEGTLSKDSSFSGRTNIWANAVAKIQENPWIGYGVQTTEWNDRFLEGSGPHNLWLMLLLQGGWILCISFIIILVILIHKALKAQNTTSTIGVVSLCVLFIMSLFETYFIAQIFLVLQFLYYASHMSNPNIIAKETNNSQVINI
jgi:O-antigen ligase